MENILNSLTALVGPFLASVIVALIILLVGWVIATVAEVIVKGILKRVQLDNRLAKAVDSKQGESWPVEHWTGRLVFWVIFLFFIVAALDVLGLTRITQPLTSLLDQFVSILPGLLSAVILALVAHVVGTIARRLVVGVGNRRNVDARLAASAGTSTSITNPVGDAVYYLVWLFFLPAILGALGLESLLVPVQSMIDQFLSYLPLLLAAAIILVVGWFVARIVQRIVTAFLASIGVDSFAERVGINKYMGSMTISSLLGLLVFIVILIPVVTASLDALNMQSLTVPLTAMINEVLLAIPNWLAAIAILVVTYVVASWLIGILVEIMGGFGVNNLPRLFGMGETQSIGGRTLAQWIGDVLLVVVMLLAAVQAAQVVGWSAVTVAVGGLGLQFVQIIFGLAIIAVGVYLANLAARFIAGTTAPNKNLLSMVARVAIIAFAGAMGLGAMGIANDIVTLAFGLFFGAIAVAVALAFGLGGREVAGRQVASWADSLETGETPQLPPHT